MHAFPVPSRCIYSPHALFPCRKREFDSRFVSRVYLLYYLSLTVPPQKNRGKRRSPDSSSSTPTTENPAKKPKVEEPLSEFPSSSPTAHTAGVTEHAQAQYQKEVQNYADRSLKDSGIGVRPLVK